MISLAQGGVQYRTRLTDQTTAERFARCLRANSRFDGVLVIQSFRAKHPTRKWMVVFSPSDPEAVEALVQRVQEEQDARGEAQWANYLVVESECRRFWYLQNFENGEVYEAHENGGCTCAHYETRLKAAALACKHSRIIQIHRALGIAITWEQAAATAPIALPDETERTYRNPFAEVETVPAAPRRIANAELWD